MSDYVNAYEALDRLHVQAVDAAEERDAMYHAVKTINAAANEPDPQLALDQVRRRCAETIKAWEARREDGR